MPHGSLSEPRKVKRQRPSRCNSLVKATHISNTRPMEDYHVDEMESGACDQCSDGGDGLTKNKGAVVYGVYDTPPWYLCIVLGLQQFLTAFGTIVAIPFILSEHLCISHDDVAKAYLINTIFFVSGLCTLLQVNFGIRLPILQGGTFAFVTPTVALLSLPEWKCPETPLNITSPEHEENWHSRMREVQGAVLVASTVEIVLGFSGLVGFVLRFVGPLCVAPTVSLIGLSLFKVASNDAGTHWGISAMTIFLIVLFSQYMKNLALPIPTYNKGCRIKWFQAFKLLPVLLAMGISWLLCYILTVCDVFPSDPQAYGHVARTDVRAAALQKSPWFRFPYPGQWGAPTVSAAGVLGILAGIVSSIVESVGDYYACARLVGAPPPPRHAVNRGIGMEGIGCLLAGAWGTGNGTTSYSENIGAIGITKVGSRMVIVTAGSMMLLLGMLGKVGAVFVTIPTPVIGGMFMVTFGIITAIGVSNLQFVDMNSTRNIFIFGFSTFAGLAVPGWLMDNPDILQTGVRELDQILQVLLTTSMFVGGFLGLLLDVTIPGTEEERGLLKWRSAGHSAADGGDVGASRAERLAREQKFYGLPFRLDARLPRSWARWLPFWPPGVDVGESEGSRQAAADTDSIPVDLVIVNNAIILGNITMNL
ncbi:solute carrier family 23 member 1-like isoform X1 [Petromyzon marinus]|uniref:solute carrier family 23 member 1-like isoform X1 n=2 Tax=Petromyzon marinus TaxID=7757 RepID=UPI003F722695